jgi:hypothetical protein
MQQILLLLLLLGEMRPKWGRTIWLLLPHVLPGT